MVVVGYPRVFLGEDCNAGTWFSPKEQARLNQTADQLSAKLSSAAAARGFRLGHSSGYAALVAPLLG